MMLMLSNDDGYFSPGLACLAEVLSAVAEVIVVAPERDRSGIAILDTGSTLNCAVHNGFMVLLPIACTWQ